MRRKLRAELLEDRRMLAAITWDGDSDGDGDNSAWLDAGNWDLNRIPNDQDDVIIPNVGGTSDTHVVVSQNRTVGSLHVQAGAKLTIASQYLALVGDAVIDGELQVGKFPDAGTTAPQAGVQGSGTLRINNSLDWNPNATISVDTVIAEAANAKLHMLGDTYGPLFATATLSNYGTVELIGAGPFTQLLNSVIENFGQFEMAGGTNLVTLNQTGGGDFFNRAGGRFIKTGSALSYILPNPSSDKFDNDGVVEIQDGSLALFRDSTSNGSFEIGATGALQLVGGRTFAFGPDSSITGVGSAHVYVNGFMNGGLSGTSRLTIEGTYDVPNTTIDSFGLVKVVAGADVTINNLGLAGILETDIDLDVNGAMQWSGGRLLGKQDAIINLKGQTNFIADAASFVIANNVRNEGFFSWSGEGILSLSGSFVNASKGTIEFGGKILWRGNSDFLNEGTLRSLPASEATVIQASYFVNEGLLEVAAGSYLVLVLSSPYIQNAGETRILGALAVGDHGRFDLNGGILSGYHLGIKHLKHAGGTIAPGYPLGKLEIGGRYEQGPNAKVEIELGGINPSQDYDSLKVFGDVSLQGELNVSYTNGFVADAGQRFPVIEAVDSAVTGAFSNQNATSLGLGIEQNAADITLLGLETIPQLVFDLRPVAIVRVGEVSLLPDGVMGGEIAELRNVRVDLLPNQDGESLASFIVDSALGLDTDNNPFTVEAFTIAPNEADGSNEGMSVPLGRLITEMSRAGTVGSSILDKANLLLKNFSGNVDGGVSGDISLAAEKLLTTFNPIGAVVTTIETISDIVNTPAAVAGQLDLADAVFRLSTDEFSVGIGSQFTLSGTNASVVLGQPSLVNEPIVTADSVTLSLDLPNVADASVSATDFQMDLTQGVTISSASGTFQANELTQTFAGILPFQVTNLELTASAAGRISLDDFTGSLKVDGYFDANFLPSGLPLAPTIQIGRSLQATGPANSFETEFRLNHGTFRPWNFGPISLGLESVPVEDPNAEDPNAAEKLLELNGELRLGGYERGAWNPDLGGYLQVVRNVAGDASLDPFVDLRFDILPQGSSLSFGNHLFSETSSLRVMGDVSLDANFQGSIGGVELKGAQLGLQFRIDASPSSTAPFFNMASSVELGELSFEEIEVEVANLGTITSSVILFDLSANPDPNEPIGRVGKIDFRPSDNSLFRGLDQSSVEIFDVEMYHDRLALSWVDVGMDGLLSWTGGASPVDLLLVDDFKLQFRDITIPSPAGGPQFGDLQDPDFSFNNPFLSGVEIASLDLQLDAAVVLPETNNPDLVPDVVCNEGDHQGTGSSADLPGIASVTCVTGSWTSAGLRLTAELFEASLYDTLHINATGITLDIRRDQNSTDAWLTVAEGTASLSLLDSAVDIQLSAQDIQVNNSGVVSLASAAALPSAGRLHDTFKIEDFLPVAVDLVRLDPLDGQTRILLNQDVNDDGKPDPEFDIYVAGAFNLSPFATYGLSVDATVGNGATNTFEATFRVQEHNGANIVSPWNTGPIQLGLQVEVGNSNAGLTFDGQVTLGGYTEGRWNADLLGSLATGASLIDDDNGVRSNLNIDLRPGSLLRSDNLTLLAQSQFSAGATGTYAGISLDNLTLGFSIILDWKSTLTAPYMAIQDFRIQAGEVVTIENFKIDIKNLVELTIDQIDLRPQPGPHESFATIPTATAVFKNSYFDGMSTFAVTVTNTEIFADHIDIGSIHIDLDGLLTVGSVDLLQFDAFRVALNNLKIGGSFSATDLNNRTVDINDDSALISGSLSDISFGTTFASLLPNSDVSASVSDLWGDFDVGTGTITLTADNIKGDIVDVFSFDTNPVTLVAGPNVLTATPFLSVDGQTTLTVNLLDEKPIDLYTNDFQISQDGVVSITSAGIGANQGLTRSFGLAEGLLPFDVTRVELAAEPGERLSISDRTLDANITVDGYFDFTVFESLPFTPVLSIGNQSADPSTDKNDPANAFHLQFNIKADSLGELPTVRLLNTGNLTLGVRDFQLGPFQLHAAKVDGEDFASQPATITLGGYENGAWNGNIDANVGVGWNGIAGNGSENSPLAIDAMGGVTASGEVTRLSDTRTQLSFDAQILGSLGLGNLPLEGDAPDERGFGFRFKDLNFDWDVQFVIRTDDNGFHLQRVGANPYIDLNGLSVAEVNLDFGGLVQMNTENAKLDFDVFARDSAGNILTSGPFLVFGGVDGKPDTRPNGNVVNQADLAEVDGSIAVTVGGGSLPGIGGKAGNFGIGWNQANVQLDPLDPNFSLGVDFYQLPGFFVSLVQPQSSDADGKEFNFGLDWFPVNVDEIGLRFNDIIEQVPGVDPSELLSIFPGGSSSNRDDEPGLIERTTRYGMNLLKDVELLFSGGFDSGKIPLIGDLIGFAGDIQKVRVDIGAMQVCAEHIWEELTDPNTEIAKEVKALAFKVVDGEIQELPGGRLLAMAALGFTELATLITDGTCTVPIKGFESVGGGANFDFGPIEISGGLGFGVLNFDRNGIAVDGDEAQTMFLRAKGNFSLYDIGLGGEIIITEYGPVLAKLLAGVPIPIGTIVGSLAGTGVFPGIGTGIGGGAGTASGFMITGTRGGIVFDGEPLPIIQDPIELVENFEITAPLELDRAQIKSAVERLFRGPNNEVLVTPRYVWDQGFSVAISGVLTNALIANNIGLNVTLGLNVGYQLPQYKLVPEGGQKANFAVMDAIRLGQFETLPGSLGEFALADLQRAVAAFDLAKQAALDAGQDPQAALKIAEAEFRETLKAVVGEISGFDPVEFLREFPFGMQLYGLADLEVFGFPIGRAGAMLDYSDPINPVINIAAQAPPEGSFLQSVFPVGAEVGLRLDSKGLVEGSIIATQAFLQSVFNRVVETGQEYFDDLMSALATKLNLDMFAINTNYAGMQLTQILLEGITPPTAIDAGFLRGRLLGGGVNDLPGIFELDLSNINLSDERYFRAANAAGELIREILTLGPELVDSASLDALNDDEWLNQLTDRAANAILDPFAGLTGVLGGSATSALDVFESAISSGEAPDQVTNPGAHALWTGYQASLRAAKAQVAFTKAFGQTLWNAGETASQLYFDTIDPSFLLKGQIQPTLLGMPLSDLGIQLPVDRIEESFTIRVDKRGVSMDADVQVLEKLLRISGLPLPLYDQLKLGVEIPTENLLRDIILSRPPVFDPTRDWRGTFQGTVGFGTGAFGFDLGDVTGLIFPRVEGDFDENDPRVGIPNDHPLMTHVRITTDPIGDFNSRPKFGQDGHVDDRVLVTKEDFVTMRKSGGILLDGRMTLPQFITDPFTWFSKLQDDVSTDLAMCDVHPDLLSCFQSLESPDQYLQFFTALKDASSTIGDGVLAEHQIAQVQVFVPNVYEEIVPLLSEIVNSAEQNLQSQIYAIFERLRDGFDIDADVQALFDAGIFKGTEVGPIKQKFNQLLDKLSEESYLKGTIGTSRILGIDFGKGILEVDNGVLTATGYFPQLETGQDPATHQGLQFDVLIDVQREPGASSYPKAGVSIQFAQSGGRFDLDNLQALLAESGIEDIPFIGPSLGAFADIGVWLNSGVLVGDVNAEFFAYTPGFDPEADDTPLGKVRRSGGIGVSSDVTLSNSFGSIDGELEFSLAPDASSPTGVAFGGLFHVAAGARFTLPDPFTGAQKTFTLAGGTVTGRVRPSGCVEVQLNPTLLSIPLTGSVNLKYALAAGACSAEVTLADREVIEPVGTSQETVRVPVRLGQLPLDWSEGDITLKYQVLGSAVYGADFAIRESTGGFIPASNSSWRTGQLTFARFDVQTSSSGELFAERFIEVVLLGDGSVTGPAEGNKQIRFEFYPPINTTEFEVTLDDRLATVSIIDGDFIFPHRPSGAAIFYDFQMQGGAPEHEPDPSSTLPYASFEDAFFKWSNQNPFAAALSPIALPDSSDLNSTGSSFQRPVFEQFDPSGIANGYEFTVEVGSLFTPDYLEFWDRPPQAQPSNGSQLAYGETQWEVYAFVNVVDPAIKTPVQLPVRELFQVKPSTVPGAHPDLMGWRKMRADFGSILREPVPASGALLAGPWPYFSGPTKLTIRMVPIENGFPIGGPVVRHPIDNVALFGGDKQRGGSFAGTNLSFDEFVNGRVEFTVTGPGIVDVSFETPPAGVDPAPFDNMAPNINVIGGDATTVVKITVTGRSADAPPLNLGRGRILSPLAKFDLSEAGEVRGRFTSTGPIGLLHIDSMADESYFLIDGSPNDVMMFIADGVVGDGTAEGFVLTFPGQIDSDVGGWDRGDLQAGSLGATTSRGDFSPNIALQYGFASIAVTGNFESSLVQTGLAPGANNGTSGPVSITDGSINITTAQIDGDLGLVQASGGSIHFDNLGARYAAGVKASSNNVPTHLANVSGNYSVSGMGSVSTFGGDILASIVTFDASAEALILIATPDSNGNGGRVSSPNSIHVAGSIGSIVAQNIDLNLVVGGRIASISVAETSLGSLSGHFRAASVGDITVHGDAGFFIETTGTASELDSQVAIDSVSIIGGDLRGGYILTSANTSISRLSVTAENGLGGNLHALLRVDGDIERLEISEVNGRIEISGDLTDYQFGTLNQTLLVTGAHSGASSVAVVGPEGQQFIEGIPAGVAPGSLIAGQVFLDLNNSGSRDAQEETAELQEVQLLDENGGLISTTLTHWRDLNRNGLVDEESENGWYVFNNIPNGLYRVVPQLAVGYRQTTPDQPLEITSPIVLDPTHVGMRKHAPWHHFANPLDINSDEFVTPLDALLIINYLNGSTESEVPDSEPTRGYLDASGDNFVTPLDALLVINFLNRNGSGEGEENSYSWDLGFYSTQKSETTDSITSTKEKPPRQYSASMIDDETSRATRAKHAVTSFPNAYLTDCAISELGWGRSIRPGSRTGTEAGPRIAPSAKSE